MPTWPQDGTSVGYVRYSSGGAYPSGSGFLTDAYKLASGGTVDLNGVTRFQYLVSLYTDLYATAKVTITAGDVAAYPGAVFTVSAFLAPASSFGPGVVPTPAMIIAAATRIDRAVNAPDGISSYFRTTAGDVYAAVFDPSVTARAWVPNIKWWYAVVPTRVPSMASPISVANDQPIGDPNVNARAISFWTNRTPAKPVITSPPTQTVTFAGSEIDFAFAAADPDEIASFPGDVNPTAFEDVAGVQVQYAPRPTEDDPTPTWIDLPIANTIGTAAGRGWYIDRSATAPMNDGAKVLWTNSTMKIRCGSTALAPSRGILPSGNWQVRMRTFDYGHPVPTGPDTQKPLTQADGLYTPSTYPAVNTSPWSDPVFISVSEQVPKPLPIYPANSIAVPFSVPVVLSWQYRNTYVPPYAQASRSVEIQEVGGGHHAIYASASAAASLDLPAAGYVVEAGKSYQWRVQVTDTNGVTSTYSDWAYFWVVDDPDSGSVRPIPSETIDGATLGCGTHRVEVYRRGGKIRVGEIRNIVHVDWNRVRDDISTAQVQISGWDVDCGNLLAQLQTWAYEIRITRDNGYSTERVWEGPITLLTYEVDKVTIDAKDMMAYAYRRIVKQAISDAKDGALVTDRAVRVLQYAMAPDDPNVLAYLTPFIHVNDAMQYRSMPAYSKTAYEEIDDMAANAGLDYTCVGRSIILWGTKNRIGTLPEFQDKDLGSPPIVSEYGMSMANRYAVSDGNGVWGEATRLDVSGNDETYGLVEMLSSTWASDAENEEGTYTQEGTATVIKSFEGFAERSIASRYPPPVVVRVPDNTTLNPDTVISIQQLVPGVVVPLRSTGTLRTVVADQKLDSIKVIEENGNPETISITLSPFKSEDGEEVTEG